MPGGEECARAGDKVDGATGRGGVVKAPDALLPIGGIKDDGDVGAKGGGGGGVGLCLAIADIPGGDRFSKTGSFSESNWSIRSVKSPMSISDFGGVDEIGVVNGVFPG